MRPLTANQSAIKSFLLSLDQHLQQHPEHNLRLDSQATATTLRFNANRLLADVGLRQEEAAKCPHRASLVPLVGKFVFTLVEVPEGETGVILRSRLRAVAEAEAQSPRGKLKAALGQMQLVAKAPQEAPAASFAQQALGGIALPDTMQSRLGALLGEEAPVEAEGLGKEGRSTAYYKR